MPDTSDRRSLLRQSWRIVVCERCGRQPVRNAADTQWLCECDPMPFTTVRHITVVESELLRRAETLFPIEKPEWDGDPDWVAAIKRDVREALAP